MFLDYLQLFTSPLSINKFPFKCVQVNLGINLYQGKQSHLNRMIFVGDMTFFADWEQDRVQITHASWGPTTNGLNFVATILINQFSIWCIRVNPLIDTYHLISNSFELDNICWRYKIICRLRVRQNSNHECLSVPTLKALNFVAAILTYQFSLWCIQFNPWIDTFHYLSNSFKLDNICRRYDNFCRLIITLTEHK